MTLRIISFIALLAFVSPLRTAAQTADYEVNIGEFSEITVAHNVNVNYKCLPDSAGYCRFSCSPADASAVILDNKKGKLRVELAQPSDRHAAAPTVTVYSSHLTKATNLADSILSLLKTSTCVSLSLKVIGNGTVKAFDVHTTKISAAVEAGCGNIFVSGDTQEAKFTLASTGSVEASRLNALSVKCWMLGTGSIDCVAEKNLSVYGASSGSLYYKGNPKVVKRSVGVKLVKMDE